MNRLFFGLEPFGYYYLQILLHVLAISLIYLIARRSGVRAFAAIVASTVFAIGGQHQLTIAWISSSGNVISLVASLAGIALFVSYLRLQRQAILLAGTTLFLLVGILSHESAVTAPLFLIALWLLWPDRQPLQKSELVTFCLWLGFMVAFIFLQIARPNANTSIDGSIINNLTKALDASSVVTFLESTLIRAFALGNPIEANAGNGTQLIQVVLGLVLLLVSLIVALRFLKKAPFLIRIGALWLVLQLGFIYLALWIRRPELLDSRHLYSAWAGFSLVIGGIIQALLLRLKAPQAQARSKNKSTFAITLSLLILTGLIYYQYIHVRKEQAMILKLAENVRAVEQQMKHLLPEPSASTKIYATRFMLSAPYLFPAAGVWYNLPQIGGGTLSEFSKLKWVNDNYYLFDEKDGILSNLLPGLQDFRKSQLLWADFPNEVIWSHEGNQSILDSTAYRHNHIVGLGEQKRLAIEVQPNSLGWISLQYDVMPVENTLFTVDYLGHTGQIFRVRVRSKTESEKILLEQIIDSNQADTWETSIIDIEPFWDEHVTLSLEINGGNETNAMYPFYLSNPRLVAP